VLSYRRHGSGPVLVMQHGFMGGGGYWLPQLAAFASEYDVIAPDLPGFAGSRDELVETSIEGHARAVVHLLDALAIPRFHLIGHSMGGMIAQQIALDSPERVSRLVLYGTTSSGHLPDRFESLAETIGRLEQEPAQRSADRIAATWFADGEASPYYPLCVEAGRGTGKQAAIAALTAIGRWDVTPRLKEIDLPSLVICGDRDRSISSEQAYLLSRLIKNSHLCIVPGCAHCAHLEAPELFNHVVRAFLSKSTSSLHFSRSI
jgi:2-hydroxy-6-oxonona-2,4-dienedioate hydrolase